jgi:hypothetical protein
VGVARYGSVKALACVIRGESLLISWPGHLGAIKQGAMHDAFIHIQNLSSEPIQIGGGRFGCKCITTSSLPCTIVPNATVTIPIRVKASGEGQKRYVITLCISSGKHIEYSGEIIYTVMP